MALINGQFPGPLLEINEGDVVNVLVHNDMPYNTTVHFHGIEMDGTPWSDGTPGLSQRQIRTGRSFQYHWKATQYGSYWYHAHQRGQIDDGLYGPILIHPKQSQSKPFSLISNDSVAIEAMLVAEQNVRPLLVSDFRHVASGDGWNIEVASGIETPCYDSILFNGKGKVQCWSQTKIDSLLSETQEQYLSAGNETQMTAKGCLPATVVASVLSAGHTTNTSAIPSSIFDVCTPTNGSEEVIQITKSSEDSVEWVAFDLIGAFGLITGFISIDSHPLYVYAVDGSYIEPQLVEAITITNGDRYSVMVQINKTGNFTIRMASTAAAQILSGYALLSVVDDQGPSSTSSSVAYIDDVGVSTTSDVVFFNQSEMKSYPPDTIGAYANATFKLGMKVAGASYNWALNNTIFPTEINNDEPLLFSPEPFTNNVTISTYYDDWVDLIFVTLSYPMPPHPIHKHGNKMWLLGSGEGEFNYSSVAEAMEFIPESFNLVDPPKRDAFATPAAVSGPMWMAVRYHVDNPGAWFLHCHIESHLLGGMGAAIQDGIDSWPQVPERYIHYV